MDRTETMVVKKWEKIEKKGESVLLIADSPLGNSSYAVVGKEMAKMLSEKYNVYYGGLQYLGMPIDTGQYVLLSFASLQNTYDNLTFINKKFDHAIYIRNAWAVNTQGDPFRILRPFSDDIMLYSPVEEQLIPRRFFTGLKGFDKQNNFYDRLITMTKFGVDVIAKHGVHADYLYHNLNEDKISYTQYHNEKNVLNISYSMDYRKNTGTYLLLAKLNPEYNFNWTGLSGYYMINDYLELYGIKNFNILNQHRYYTSFNFLTDKQIADIYAQNNFYIQPSFKEGFDLTTLEALSNGLITFMPDDALHRELFGDFPNAVFVKGSYLYPAMNQLEYFIPINIWDSMFKAYCDKKRMGIMKKERFSFTAVKNKLFKILGGN